MAHTERNKKPHKVVAVLLLLAGAGLLWYNEGRSAATGDAISEARSAAVALTDVGRLDPAFNGKMVYATGLADVKEAVTDPVIGVKATVISLERRVQYYQWVESSRRETRNRPGGGTETVTVYDYSRQWSSSPVNSSLFHEYTYRNENHVLMRVPSETLYADEVTFGAYKLPTFILNSVSGSGSAAVEALPDAVENLDRQIARPGLGAYVHVQGNVVYLGRSPSSPNIGDVRVTYNEVKPGVISILAQVAGDTFEPFRASNGNTFSKVSMGTVGMDEM
ncbi:MAG: TMEM43 family protein, partial [Synergistaceae bacterium]|nr:TMEM43 family protein [Synergistaceae bacterium]